MSIILATVAEEGAGVRASRKPCLGELGAKSLRVSCGETWQAEGFDGGERMSWGERKRRCAREWASKLREKSQKPGPGGL